MLLLMYLILDDPYVLAKMFYDILLMMYTMCIEHSKILNMWFQNSRITYKIHSTVMELNNIMECWMLHKYRSRSCEYPKMENLDQKYLVLHYIPPL